MVSSKFFQRKMDILSKPDKSSAGKWDNKITNLCELINSKENYYTTSSCSGRILFIIEQDKKGEGLFLRVYHDAVNFDDIKKDLNEFAEISRRKKINVIFKQEPAILHIVCRNLESAKILMQKAILTGWKRSALISWEENFILELLNTERLEFPVIADGKILIIDEFLRICLEKANGNLEKSWLKIEKLRESL